MPSSTLTVKFTAELWFCAGFAAIRREDKIQRVVERNGLLSRSCDRKATPRTPRSLVGGGTLSCGHPDCCVVHGVFRKCVRPNVLPSPRIDHDTGPPSPCPSLHVFVPRERFFSYTGRVNTQTLTSPHVGARWDCSGSKPKLSALFIATL